MKKKYIYISTAVLAVLLTIVLLTRQTSQGDSAIVLAVSTGEFVIDIVTSGELEAKNSVKIMGPASLRNFRIYNMTIQDIIDEGTVVEEGQWVATIDRSDFDGKLKDVQIDMEKEMAEYTQTQLDTTLQMREARDELVNLEYAVEEMKIKLEQSKFEPPATIKQAEIDLEKATRKLQQAIENYSIKHEKNSARMRERDAELRKRQNEYNKMNALSDKFNIKAPKPGMVIYAKGWDGKAIKSGSQISTYSPTVATLPDLTIMLSKVYINEVDVRKIKQGQQVEVGLDAFPEKKLTGKVIRVANVGEQRPNSDSKVFEATIEIDGTDDMLRPAMTTSNRIIIERIDSALYVPLECLHNQDDSINYVIVKAGINTVKQEVEVGARNSNHVIIKSGVDIDDKLYMSIPGGVDGKDVELLAHLNGKRNQKKEEPKAETKRRRGQMPPGAVMGGKKRKAQ